MPKALRQEESIEISRLESRLFFSRALERVYIRHSGLVRSQLLVTRLPASVVACRRVCKHLRILTCACTDVRARVYAFVTHTHVFGQSRIVIRNLLEHSPSNSRYSRSVSSSRAREPLDEEMIVSAARL